MNNDGFLRGKRVVVTRPEHQSDKILLELRLLGAIPIHLPVIKVVPCGDVDEINKAIEELGSFDWVVFTSANGVRFFLEEVKVQGSVETLVGCQIAAVGSATSEVLENLLRKPDAVPSEFVSDEIVNALGDVLGKRILLANAKQARKALPEALIAKGARVTNLVLYDVENNLEPELKRMVEEVQTPDFLTFTSSSSVRGFNDLMNRSGKDWLLTVPAVCIGPVTAKTLESLGVVPYRVAKIYTVEGIIEALTT